ncbi:MAG: hypothetical protein ACK4YO_01920 [Candidatus Altarchaeaceae archaeon]
MGCKARIECEIYDIEKGKILEKIINFDNIHTEDLYIETKYDEEKKILITEIRCSNLKTLQNTIYDLIKTQKLAEKIIEI